MDAKILIVDDEPAIRKLLARYLQEEGYDCQFAETVANAKEILASNTFDLLLRAGPCSACKKTLPADGKNYDYGLRLS